MVGIVPLPSDGGPITVIQAKKVDQKRDPSLVGLDDVMQDLERDRGGTSTSYQIKGDGQAHCQPVHT
jgi:hypothetical protein